MGIFELKNNAKTNVLTAQQKSLTGDGCSGIGNLNGFDVYSSGRAFGAINTVRREVCRGRGSNVFSNVILRTQVNGLPGRITNHCDPWIILKTSHFVWLTGLPGRSKFVFCSISDRKRQNFSSGESKFKHWFSLSSTFAVASAVVMAGDWNRILLGTRRFWRKLCRN